MTAGGRGAARLDFDDSEWETFVAGRAEATPFHHPAWARLLVGCYPLRGFGLAVRGEAGDVVAGLPVIELKGLRSRRLMALPFTDGCGPLGDVAAAAAAFDDARLEDGLAGEIRAPVEGGAAEQFVRG